ncbi:MAG: hypothetical protein LOY00_11900 [Methylocaldum sp.]|nr:hypothetical protein [Methylocaldum sp.]
MKNERARSRARVEEVQEPAAAASYRALLLNAQMLTAAPGTKPKGVVRSGAWVEVTE